jgi:hypothetical protein
VAELILTVEAMKPRMLCGGLSPIHTERYAPA